MKQDYYRKFAPSLLMILICSFACEEAEPIRIEGERPDDAFYLRGSLLDSTGVRDTFAYRNGPADGWYYVFQAGSDRGGFEREPTFSLSLLEAGPRPDNNPGIPSSEIMRLMFWPNFPLGQDLPTLDELSELFEVGRTYPFGYGPGRVNLGYRIPKDSLTTFRLSYASFLAEPAGELRITETEVTEFLNIPENVGGTSRGLAVTFSFSGRVGVYDHDQWLGTGTFQLNEFLVDQEVNIRGEGRFFTAFSD